LLSAGSIVNVPCCIGRLHLRRPPITYTAELGPSEISSEVISSGFVSLVAQAFAL